MKVVKHGNPWWVGVKISCRHCGSEMELELQDRPSYNVDNGLTLDLAGHFVLCAVCSGTVKVPYEFPNIKQAPPTMEVVT